jgi:hypothetical protein
VIVRRDRTCAKGESDRNAFVTRFFRAMRVKGDEADTMGCRRALSR